MEISAAALVGTLDAARGPSRRPSWAAAVAASFAAQRQAISSAAEAIGGQEALERVKVANAAALDRFVDHCLRKPFEGFGDLVIVVTVVVPPPPPPLPREGLDGWELLEIGAELYRTDIDEYRTAAMDLLQEGLVRIDAKLELA